MTLSTPWHVIPPMPLQILASLSGGLRRFCHDANNALTAGFAGQELALMHTAEETQRRRLGRVDRQLRKLNALVSDMQLLPFRGEVDGDSKSALIADVSAAGKKRDVTLSPATMETIGDLGVDVGWMAARHAVGLWVAASATATTDRRITLESKAGEYLACVTMPMPRQDDSTPIGCLGVPWFCVAGVLSERGFDTLVAADGSETRFRLRPHNRGPLP